MTASEVQRVLRESRDKMNNKGAHWIKGTLSKKQKNGEVAFCAIGAICDTLGVRGSNDVCPTKAKPVVLALANAIREHCRPIPGNLYVADRAFIDADSALKYVEGYNDYGKNYPEYGVTTWEDIRKVFTEAARSPRKYLEMAGL